MLLEKNNDWSGSGLKFPGGPLEISSPQYVARFPLESLAEQELEKVGSVIRIQATKQMGKSSFLGRLLAKAEFLDYQVVKIDFLEADDSIFVSLDRFLRWFSANVSRRLGRSSKLDEFWDPDLGAKVSCTYYFEDYVLEGAERPIVLALNEVNRIFEYPEIAKDFLPLLRFWNEQSKQGDLFHHLRMVIVHSTEVYVPLKIHQSPFNIGCPIKLPEFNLEQCQELARRYGITEAVCSLDQLDVLLSVVGGSPYRLGLAFYFMQSNGHSLSEILEMAVAPEGIYYFHLQDLWLFLNQSSDLRDALEQVMLHEGGATVETRSAYLLNQMGLVTLNGLHATVSCELYRRFFWNQFQRQKTPRSKTLADDQKTVADALSKNKNVSKSGVVLNELDNTANVTSFLGGRYTIHSQISGGGFGTTYLAKDTHRPGAPQCVVKKLIRDFEAESLDTARRLFATEAQTLEQLGNHDRIPRLLAYFEQDEDFFLVQELVEGTLFSDELAEAMIIPDEKIIAFLLEILEILDFVHQHQVIHRDVKPDNIIRRVSDGRLVLIDFGSAKLLSSLPLQNNQKTIAIGTQGYVPWEQNQGIPRLNSDIYALGVIAIEMATGRLPSRLECDDSMELRWRSFAPHRNSWLTAVIEGMVKHNYRDRYQTPQEIIKDLQMIADHG